MEGLDYSLTGDDLKCLGLDWITYSELVGRSLEDILPVPDSAVALLYETEHNRGHWVLLWRKDANTLEFFDSYGLAPDAEEAAGAAYSAQQGPRLTSLIRAWTHQGSGRSAHYSPQQLQEFAAGDNTCGRWAYKRWKDRETPLEEWLGQWGADHRANDKKVVEETEADLARCVHG
jgi:hypothetical protein